jgi:hypothetical protein
MAVNCVDAVAMLDDVDHLERLLATLNRTQRTHSAECWRWHQQCAVEEIERLLALAHP